MEGGEPPASFNPSNYEWAGSELQAPSAMEENEIHVMEPLQRVGVEVERAIQVLRSNEWPTSGGPPSLVSLRAMGRAIHRTICIAEIIKRRIPGLHQVNEAVMRVMCVCVFGRLHL